jgi:hypothetical protein
MLLQQTPFCLISEGALASRQLSILEVLIHKDKPINLEDLQKKLCAEINKMPRAKTRLTA